MFYKPGIFKTIFTGNNPILWRSLLIGLVCLTLVVSKKPNRNRLNEPCTVPNTGNAGICSIIKNCSRFKYTNDVLLRDNYCGILHRKKIICCALPPPPSNQPIIKAATDLILLSNRTCALKCSEYRRPAYEIESKLDNTLGKLIPQNNTNCVSDSIPFIVGGTEALEGEFPHMVAVGYIDENDENDKIKWSCGGSLISDEYILTAAHCITGSLGEAKYIKLGAHKLQPNITTSNNNSSVNDEDHSIILNISDCIYYPDYRPNSKYHDIALIKLEKKIKFNTFIRPGCLPPITLNDLIINKLIATGWGQMGHGGKKSNVLLKVGLERFTYDDCSGAFPQKIDGGLDHGINDTSQICAGSRTSAKDTCQGDSGGPLQITHFAYHCMHIIVGITSFGGIACGNIGVYTRVAPYVQWIEDTVWNM